MNLIGAGIETPKAQQGAPNSGKILQFPFCIPLHSRTYEYWFFSWLIRCDMCVRGELTK